MQVEILYSFWAVVEISLCQLSTHFSIPYKNKKDLNVFCVFRPITLLNNVVRLLQIWRDKVRLQTDDDVFPGFLWRNDSLESIKVRDQ